MEITALLLLAVSASFAADVKWVHSSHNMSATLGARVAAALGNHSIVFAGGSGPNKSLSTEVDAFDVTSQTWSVLSALPHGHAGSSTLGGQLDTAGVSFFSGGAAVNRSGVVDLLQASTRQWLPSLQTQLTHEFTACGGTGSTVICAGGQGQDKHDPKVPFATDVFTLDSKGAVTAHDTSYQLSEARKKLSVAAAGGLIGFAMGYSDDEKTVGYSTRFDIFNTSNGKWFSGELPSGIGRQYGTAVGCGGMLIWAGGQVGGGRASAVDILDSATGKWSNATLSNARSNLGAACAGDRFALFAGGQIPRRGTVDLLDTTTGKWSVLEDLSVPRGWVSGAGAGPCAAFGGGAVVDIYCFSEE